MLKYIALLILALAFPLGQGCGDDSDGGSCAITYVCNGSGCMGTGSACASGDLLEDEGITNQTSCEAWARAVGEEKDAQVTTAIFEPDGDC